MPERSSHHRITLTARRAWAVFAVTTIVLLAIALYVAGFYGRNAALDALTEQGRTEANLKVALLRAVLERPRALPYLLARDRDVEETLANPDTPHTDALDRKLEDLVAGTSASVMYVINRAGRAIAASNWQEPTSFVGNDYAFRAYFSGALQRGTAEHFALGSVSKRPGLYISHRVGPAEAPLGVVVVKMEFDGLEADWGESTRPSYVIDENNVVLITSIPSWRFMTTVPVAAEKLASIRQSLQFGAAPLAALPMTIREEREDGSRLLQVFLPGGEQHLALQITVPVATTPWRFQYLVAVEAAVAASVREARLAATLTLAALLLLAAIQLRRRLAARVEREREQAARAELEKRVQARTLELSLARDKLQAEITDHRATEARLQAVQQDLVQANRLAILGQVAAGVAHEINQPVATIRAYADNAKVFLDRRQSAPVAENLGHIASLTDRIGAITDDLKSLARRGRSGEEAVELAGVFESAVWLLRSRFTGRLASLHIEPPPPKLHVLGTRLRLEQVFINLFQNALEALGDRPDGKVSVSTRIDDEDVVIKVADNGPGIAPDVMASMFEPFNTSKEKGLGLGLVIVKDIVSDYRGRIEVESDEDGARFRVHLRKAEP